MARKLSRIEAENKGRRAEKIAAWWLRLHGWQILTMRAKTPKGEVDIIARRGKSVIFVEVKARDNEQALGTAIGEYQLKRVAAAAQFLIPKYAKNAENIQIDVIWVAPWRLPHHIKNIWHY
ncbi:hypothetical protein LPB140_06295 [Sphingorhabdus lutea]|uniref:UPF0102 protein LPB140_06295 n=1 Tax=Sphingorhabdus lutea TaxID=1913578 RepID=A0A1L3JBF5_9SPHN|nr:YraN family protein [Sphingorhabdus lutea]APG62462.1 hypothetical protein LPB140_06295 [Sphingorhabdus lutea]